MRILVTGGHGQLGSELARCLSGMAAEIGPVPSLYAGAQLDCVGREAFDIADASAVEAWFERHAYDVVFNCASATNVDGCEADEQAAYRVNALGARNVARAAAAQGAKVVQVSTDYVFSGNERGERAEADEVGPLSAYGRTKLAGEQLALEANPRCFVVRTAWLYGYAGKNFVKTMKTLGEARSSVSVVDDQLGNPTNANDLAYALLKIAATSNYGIYHATGKGTCSWAQFAEAVMEEFGLACRVERISSARYAQLNPAAAPRPPFSALRNKRLEDTLGDEFRPWREALATYAASYSRLAE